MREALFLWGCLGPAVHFHDWGNDTFLSSVQVGKGAGIQVREKLLKG